MKLMVKSPKTLFSISALIFTLFLSGSTIFADGENKPPQEKAQKIITMDGADLPALTDGDKIQNPKNAQVGGKNSSEVSTEEDAGGIPARGSEPIDNAWKITAFIVAASAVAGGAAVYRRKNNSQAQFSNESYVPSNLLGRLKDHVDTEELKKDLSMQNLSILEGELPQKPGLWLAPADRVTLLTEINEISAKKYTVNYDGYLVPDLSQPIDTRKSITASKVIDALISRNNRTLVGVDEEVHKYDHKSNTVYTQSVTDGITVGDKDTGYAVIVSNAKNSGITLFHELGHALDTQESAIQIENKIRQELGLKTRVVDHVEEEAQFYNNYAEGEGKLEDFAKALGATVNYDSSTETAYVQHKGVTGDFMSQIDGSYFDPATNKLIVRKKQFNYKLNLDIKPDEVYLRSYASAKGGQVDWIEAERKAVISLAGKTYELSMKDKGVKIINDRMVLTREAANALLEIMEDGYSSDANSPYNQSSNTNKPAGSNNAAANNTPSKSANSSANNTTNNTTNKSANNSTKAATPKVNATNNSSAAANTNNGYSFHQNYDTALFSDANLQNTQMSGFGKSDVAQLAALLGAGLLIKKSTSYLLAGNRSKQNLESYQAFTAGINEELQAVGLDSKELSASNNPANPFYVGAAFLSRAAMHKESQERKILFAIVAEDMEIISGMQQTKERVATAKKYGRALTAAILSQVTMSGLVEAVKAVSGICEEEREIKNKIERLEFQSQLAVKVQEYLVHTPKKLDEIIFKAKLVPDGYVLEMWEWEIKFTLKTALIGNRKASILRALCQSA